MSSSAGLAEQLHVLQSAVAAAQQRAVAGGLPPAERDALKAEIIALYKRIDVALGEIAALKEQVKVLAGVWKALAPDAPSSAASAPEGRLRVDHLGASTFIEKGWSRLSLGDAPGAEAALRQALRLAPGSAEAETLLGWSLLLQEQLEAATAHLQAVVDRDPQRALAWATLGAVAVRRGDWAAALDCLDLAMRGDRDRKATLYAHLYLGQLHGRQARYGDAERALLTALELGPNLLEARYELGWTYWLAGRVDDALTAWRLGATANKFSPWGKRCADVVVEVEQGGAPVRR